jgi:hypothetical protein
LERFRDFNCTDPRDKVYALLGLASVDKNMPLPKPDYSKSVSEVYITTARAIIQYTRDLTVLCLPKSYAGITEHNLPFWCPDWTTQPDEIPLLRDDNDWPTFNATLETLPQGPDFNFEAENDQSLPKRRSRKPDKNQWVAVESESDELIPSTIRHPEIDIRSPTSTEELTSLILKGYIIDGVREVGKSIPASAFKTDEWKKIVVEWEALLDNISIVGYHGENRNSPEAQKAKLRCFLSTLCRGVIIFTREAHTVKDGMDILLEFYFIWTGRMQPSEAKSPHSVDPAITNIFEDELLQYLKHWKMALGWEGRLMLVPKEAEGRDNVVVLFGADVPLLLRPEFIIKSSGQRYLRHIGTVFAMDLMRGEAIYSARMENSPVDDIGLF